MLAQGTPLHVASEVLEHSSIPVTADVYAQPSKVKSETSPTQWPQLSETHVATLQVVWRAEEALQPPDLRYFESGRRDLNPGPLDAQICPTVRCAFLLLRK
jgi:hypothetical protein